MTRVALIDGDSFAFRVAAACEKTIYLVGNKEYPSKAEAVAAASDSYSIWSRREVSTLKDASDSLEKAIERSISRVQCGVFHVFMGGTGPTFRDHLARLRRYKGLRGTQTNPVHLSDLRSNLSKFWGAVECQGEETDDALSYTSRELSASGSMPVVVGNDKDLDQIPGEHYNWVTEEKYNVTEAEARTRLWVQVLCGDSTDNVAGCFRVGLSKATRIVEKCIKDGWTDGYMWELVKAAYTESQEKTGCPYAQYDPVEVALENYHLIRLRQSRHEKHDYRGLFPKEKNKQSNYSSNGSSEIEESKETASVPLEVGSEGNCVVGPGGC